VVHEPVVAPAEKDEIVDTRRTAVRPMTNVMRVAPARRSITGGKRAAVVAYRDRAPKRRRHDLGLPTDVERPRAGVRDHPSDVGVARPTSRRLGRHRASVLELTAATESALERLEVHRHNYVRTLAGNDRTVGKVQPLTTDLAERVGAPLGGRAGIFDARTVT
jgi:hypothetical protein